MKKGGGSESTRIIGPSKSVLVYAIHSLENVLGLARFRVFVPKLYYKYQKYDATFNILTNLPIYVKILIITFIGQQGLVTC